MNLTTELLEVLGSPFVSAPTVSIVQSRLAQLCHTAVKNRILFSYLEKIGRPNLGEFAPLYEKENLKYLKTDDAIARASQVLTDANIKHAVIKTIRPYKSTTVDIDVLIFGPNFKYEKAILTFLEADYEMLGRGPQSATLQDPRINIKIDIYKEVAVSHIVYLDKQKLTMFSTVTKLPNGEPVRTLTPEADLATLISHSLIKEHMYTISEYYSFVNYLKQLNLDNFIQLVMESNITVATQTHATITAVLHKAAFGTIPEPLQEILNCLGIATLEATLVMKNDLKTPHKYHPITIAKSLLEIAKGEKSRKSIAIQLLRMLKPSFTKELAKLLMDHITRETY